MLKKVIYLNSFLAGMVSGFLLFICLIILHNAGVEVNVSLAGSLFADNIFGLYIAGLFYVLIGIMPFALYLVLVGAESDKKAFSYLLPSLTFFALGIYLFYVILIQLAAWGVSYPISL